MKPIRKETRCAFCQATNDAHMGVGSEAERAAIVDPGSVSICFRCGEASIMGNEGALRKPTAAEEAEISSDRTVRLVKMMRSKHLQSEGLSPN